MSRSWHSDRAAQYRLLNGIPDQPAGAVLVQAMVMGNRRIASGSGVGFTRNPATGRDELFVDFLENAQGEDVVSGRRRVAETATLRDYLPAVDRELRTAKSLLEQQFRDMQDFEFTVDSGVLYFLQARSGKRTAWAAVQTAVEPRARRHCHSRRGDAET